MAEAEKQWGGKRAGAGRKPTGRVRSAHITILCTPEEKERISSDAKAKGMTVTDYALSKLLQ